MHHVFHCDRHRRVVAEGKNPERVPDQDERQTGLVQDPGPVTPMLEARRMMSRLVAVSVFDISVNLAPSGCRVGRKDGPADLGAPQAFVVGLARTDDVVLP